ncbi:MAG: hypothetical protein VKP62_04940 [Candidatus Sericytochromatia bacterium]|nr:hypothetical protein [Candidatus Sericytochromatia bacterium]
MRLHTDEWWCGGESNLPGPPSTSLERLMDVRHPESPWTFPGAAAIMRPVSSSRMPVEP